MLLPAQIALARIDFAKARAPKAIDRLRAAIDHAESEVDPAQPRLLDARLWLASAQAIAGDCDTSRSGAKSAMLTVRQNHLDSHPLLAAALKAAAESKGCSSPTQ